MSLRQPSALFFAVVAGGYVGLLATVVTGPVIGVGYLTSWPVVIGVGVGFAIAVQCYTRSALASKIVRSRLYLLPLAVPLSPFFAGPLFALLGRHGYETVVTVWIYELLAVALAGAIFSMVTVNRHVVVLHERESVLAEWRARPDSRYRWLVRLGGFGVGCSCFVGGFVFALFVDLTLNPFPVFGGVLIAQALTIGRYRTYTLFESGLCIQQSKTFNYRFVPRTQLRSVDLADDRLTIRREFPWPLPIRCATATILRPRQVTDAFEQLLESNQAVTWQS
ncbi:hypothetical protein [Natrinema salinisoli]|uniref:hypothetical protein n=1 Tax=Natrinema salinisoli TaxID=2878535 RepID=UPI001CF050AC|nr:hypothetical protein [Natrinema salinisoli]